LHLNAVITSAVLATIAIIAGAGRVAAFLTYCRKIIDDVF
jgi:hypothetical protein